MDVPPTQPLPEEAPQTTGVPRRRVPLSNLQIILIVLIAVGGRLAIDFSQRIVDGQKKINEQHALEAEIEDLKRDQQRLEAEKAYYSSSSFVEAWAHDEGKMVRDGERIVVPLYEDVPQETSQQIPASVEQEPAIPAWQVWWTLFFDTAPPFISAAGS